MKRMGLWHFIICEGELFVLTYVVYATSVVNGFFARKENDGAREKIKSLIAQVS